MLKKLFAPLNQQQLKILGLSAPLFENNEMKHDSLYGSNQILNKDSDITKTMIKRDWGIDFRESLFESLGFLVNGGHRDGYFQLHSLLMKLDDKGRKAHLNLVQDTFSRFGNTQVAENYRFDLVDVGIEAWDRARYAALCRWGACSDYISDEESWDLMATIFDQVKERFKSWQQYCLSFMAGRQYWRNDLTEEYTEEMNDLLVRLLFNDDAVYKKIGPLEED
jgi:hypothetical protein